MFNFLKKGKNNFNNGFMQILQEVSLIFMLQ